MKLSDILEEVAHRYETGEYPAHYFSCFAVRDLLPYNKKGDKIFLQFCEGIENMGLISHDYTCGFNEIPFEEIRQARMIWLTWCAMMAREQGL